jgi:hypothetical protein
MKTVIFLAAMTMALTVKAQTIDKPIVLKNFNKDQDHNVWYISKKTDEQNIKMIMYSTEENKEYYKYTLELFDFDPDTYTRMDGVVRIWEDDNYSIRVIEKKYTIISVTKY